MNNKISHQVGNRKLFFERIFLIVRYPFVFFKLLFNRDILRSAYRYLKKGKFISMIHLFLEKFISGGLHHKMVVSNQEIYETLKQNDLKSKDYVCCTTPALEPSDIKLIAFYLPQFHPIPENDQWWGKGFTEWTNVSKAIPQFIGHYQPRLPGELGFYDLRLLENQQKQVSLAKQYGLHGFCMYFYWFGGKTLLEEPIKKFANSIDFPFCLAWANENWTRRWDGFVGEILISQQHSADDDVAFIQYIANYLRQKNYIRIGGRALLIVYRPELLPDPKATGLRWRNWCRNNGIGELYLCCVHSSNDIDPRSIGFDAAIEFPPNHFPLKNIAHEKRFDIFNPAYIGGICDYRELVYMANHCYSIPEYKKFRGVCPSWDNDARTPGRGRTLINSTPLIFKDWVKAQCHFTHNNFDESERFVFINAWNEWGEGAYLEPDRKYGYAYLQAIADAVNEYEMETTGSAYHGKV